MKNFLAKSPSQIRKSGYAKIIDADNDLLEEIKEIWKEDGSYDKFMQLKRVMLESHAKKEGLVKTVIMNRVLTLLICLMSALIIFYLYVIDVTSVDGRDLR
jgi:hypothetical protein